MKIIALALSTLLAVTGLVSGLDHDGKGDVRGLISKEIVSADGMMMGGTLVDFLNSMVGFGDITQAQMNTILGLVTIKNNEEHLETISHGNGDATFQKQALTSYIQAQLTAGTISAETGDYLSGLLQLNNGVSTPGAAAAASSSASTPPATANYSGNGNVVLLGTLKPNPNILYNGIWGVAIAGREYAMQCSVTGLHIIDVTNPVSPFQVQFIPMTGGNPWRDSNVHTDSNGVTYAYVAAQGGSSPSLFIIRLSALAGTTAPGPNSNPIPPTDIVNRGYVGLGHTMNVENGLLFLNSAQSGNGCRILDLEADPFNPPQLNPWVGSGKDCHDSYQRNGVMVNGSPRNLLFTADGYSRRYRISDITDIRSGGSPQQIGSTAFVSGIYAHSLAVSEDKKTMYTFEEFDVYDIGVYDISNPATTFPQINTFTWSGDVSVGSARVHNGHIRGKYLLVAYYEAGLRIFDVSNPLNPLEVGKYESWRDPDGDGNYQNGISGNYRGAWNLHPYLPSGNVLLSDYQSGLFIVQVNPVPLPAVPSNVVATGSSSSSVTLTWDAVSGATGYTIQRGTSSGVYDTTLATNVVGTSYMDSSVSGGALYYAVSATNAEGASGPSTSIPAPVDPTPAPVAPPTPAPVVPPTPAPVVPPTPAPVVPPTPAPVVPPTPAPVVPPTPAPVVPPTPAPVVPPTPAPVVPPTPAPVVPPTPAPVVPPTPAPVVPPTPAPVVPPTPAPVVPPTPAPVVPPTPAPVVPPTPAPVVPPTPAPVVPPTPAPVVPPTPAPVASTPAPVVSCGDDSMVLTQPLDVEIRENANRGGTRGTIVVDRTTNQGEARALIKFPEISTNIPNGATITSAQLRFFTKNPTSTAGIISGYTMSAVWDNNSNWAAVNGGVDLTTNPQISFSFTASTDEENVFVNVSPVEIQAWLDGSTSNEGWVMVSDSSNNWKFRSVNGRANQRPYLTVNYNTC